MKFNSIKIEITNPTLYQWFVVKTYNFLLWWAIVLFNDDPDKLEYEIKDLLKTAHELLSDN